MWHPAFGDHHVPWIGNAPRSATAATLRRSLPNETVRPPAPEALSERPGPFGRRSV
jgi:hypothetical protein